LSQHEHSEALFRSSLPEELTDTGEPVFVEPWQAQAFAMTVSLHNRGVFTWSEWARAISEKLAERTAKGDDHGGRYYYDDWLAALETLVGIQTDVRPSELADLKDRWARAYRTTPHGEKVVLNT
jgi:nitrile hydratase accessory protein